MAIESALPALARAIGLAPTRREPLPWLKPGVFIGSLVPLGYLMLRASRNELGANPIADAINELGLTALILLVATLACTPARYLFKWTWPIRIRRELGLFAFFYASLHFVAYIALDQLFAWEAIVADVTERPFITAGFAAFVLLVPLAWTSTNAWVRRLGYYRWLRLHQLIYLAGALAVLHFIWRVKIDVSQPVAYAVVIAGLLGVRFAFWLRKRSAKKAR